MPEYFLIIFIFVFGACIGSFLNVCIYRIPEGKSTIYPSSRCPQCGHSIAWYDNIPIFSYLLLKRRCRHCGMIISWRYPLIEGLSGGLAILTFLKFGLTAEALICFAFATTLLVISVIDIDHMIIPDIISLPAIPICVLASLVLPGITLLGSIMGLLIGGGSLYLIAEIYYLLKKEEGMGGGDIKLLAMIGALTGWQGVIFSIFLGSAIGTVSGLSMMAIERSPNMKFRIPFGPFLSLGAVLYIFWGPELIRWYLSA